MQARNKEERGVISLGFGLLVHTDGRERRERPGALNETVMLFIRRWEIAMSCRPGSSPLRGNCLRRLSQTWPGSGHMLPPRPASSPPRRLPAQDTPPRPPSLPTCVQHRRGSRPPGAGAPARAARDRKSVV